MVLGNLQGRPIVITGDDDFSPKVFPSMDEAREFATSDHIAMRACESIVIVDIDTGDTETI